MLELSFVDFDDINKYSSYTPIATPSSSKLYEAVFSSEVHPQKLTHTIKLSSYSDIQQRIEKVAQLITPKDSGASGEAGVSVSWGGSNGIEVSGYGKAEAHDDHGNYVEGRIEGRSDGTGSAQVSAGHKED